MAMTEVGAPLAAVDLPVPEPAAGQLLLRVHACGICRTDLHLIDGEVSVPALPRVLGHQIVGTDVESGRRVGVPWLGWTCGTCPYCQSGRENLCPQARFTGRDIDGGMAEYVVADERYCFALPDGYPDLQAAPLMCAGLIGYRSLEMCGDAARIGFYGFGSAAHILTQLATWQGREIFAFTQAGDVTTQAFARSLGAVWAGSSGEPPPEPLDAAIVFAPVGSLVPAALRAVAPGGTVVCAGIHMSDIPSFSYDDLWMERTIRSVANLTRSDGEALLALAPQAGIKTEVTVYPLEHANEALADLRAGRFDGSGVLEVAPSGPAG